MARRALGERPYEERHSGVRKSGNRPIQDFCYIPEEIIHANQYAIELFSCSTFKELLDYTSDTFRGFVYDVLRIPERGHVFSFNAAPASIEGCCAFVFTVADDKQ